MSSLGLGSLCQLLTMWFCNQRNTIIMSLYAFLFSHGHLLTCDLQPEIRFFLHPSPIQKSISAILEPEKASCPVKTL